MRGQSGFWEETIALDADGRFTLAFRGCMGPSDTAGRAGFDGGRLLFPDDRAPRAPSAQGLRPIDGFQVVPWGERTYLVRDVDLLDFCNRVNAGYEPREIDRGGFFYMREGDAARPAEGRPELPSEWDAYVLDEPLVGVTTEITGGATWVDIGANDGLRGGMELILLMLPVSSDAQAQGAPPARDQPLSVLAIEPDRCLVRLKYAADGRPPVAVGMTVSTRASD